MNFESKSLSEGRQLIDIKDGKETITLLLAKDWGVEGIYSTLEGSLKGGLMPDEIERLRRGRV